MIVRISTEGQYRIGDDHLARLQELDGEVVAAAEADDTALYAQRFAALLEFVRAGEALDDAHLAPSDAILPPPDSSLAEALAELRTDGLIPD